MPDVFSIMINDFDGQQGIFTGNCETLTAANFTAQMTEQDALNDTLPDIILGTVIANSTNHRIQKNPSGSTPADPFAQRGNKWHIFAVDITDELFTGFPNPYYWKPFDYELPTADLSLRVNDSNLVWVQGGANNVADFDPFVAAFNAYAKSPVGGVLTVQRIEAMTTAGG